MLMKTLHQEDIKPIFMLYLLIGRRIQMSMEDSGAKGLCSESESDQLSSWISFKVFQHMLWNDLNVWGIPNKIWSPGGVGARYINHEQFEEVKLCGRCNLFVRHKMWKRFDLYTRCQVNAYCKSNFEMRRKVSSECNGLVLYENSHQVNESECVRILCEFSMSTVPYDIFPLD